MDNPYLAEFQKVYIHHPRGMWRNLRQFPTQMEFDNERSYGKHGARWELVHRYAWAIPNEEAIQAITAAAPVIVEIGAGSGYWAKLLSDAGSVVHAYDILDESWHREAMHYPVKRGTHASQLKHKAENFALMLCWPPYAESLAVKSLRLFKGQTLIYIGEGRGGCTGDDAFFDLLESDWTCTSEIAIPQWFGIHDWLMIYTRA